MTDSASLPTVLCISGSLRSQSNSTAVMNTIADMLEGQAKTERFDIGSLPFYNADLDTETPPATVKALKDTVAAADGVVIVTPEYNYSVPGVLKNAIDWASRPGYNSVFKGKPVFVVTTSGGALGGVRAQSHLKTSLGAMLAKTFVWQEFVVPMAGEKVKDGKLVDPATKDFIQSGLTAFVASF